MKSLRLESFVTFALLGLQQPIQLVNGFSTSSVISRGIPVVVTPQYPVAFGRSKTVHNNGLLPNPISRANNQNDMTQLSASVAEEDSGKKFLSGNVAAALSASSLIVLDVAFRRLLKSLSISFPSSLAGCGTLFASMLTLCAINEKWGDTVYNLFSPGSALLAKWLPVFFVPSLVTLPLAQSLGSSVEVCAHRINYSLHKRGTTVSPNYFSNHFTVLTFFICLIISIEKKNDLKTIFFKFFSFPMKC